MIVFLEEQGLPPLEKQQIENILDKNLIDAASIASSKLRKANFREFLDEEFIKPKPVPHEIHDIIVTLGPNCFITTNYDHLIEDAYRKNHDGKTLFSVNNDQPIEHAKILKNSADQFIFTPHGRIERSDTIIFTKNDYRKLKSELKSTINTLRHLFVSRPVIYLGFSLTDPDFIAIKDEIDCEYQGGEREHFAIIPDVCDLEKIFWKEHYGITIVSYDTIMEDNEISHVNFLKLIKEIHYTIQQDRLRLQNGHRFEELTKQNSRFKISKQSLIRFCQDIEYSYSNLSGQNFELHFQINDDFLKKEKSKEYQFLKLVNKWGLVEVNDFFEKSHNFILIGSPGSGKTYSVKKYAADMANKSVATLKDPSIYSNSQIVTRIPLILPMKEYNSDIKEMISSRILKSIDVNSALEAGIFTFIFDGINEVSREFVERNILEPDLLLLYNKYPKNRFIFTSRSKEYLNFLPLPIVELTPLFYFEIESILKDSINQTLAGQPENIQEILSNPFFLTIYLKANQDTGKTIINLPSLLSQYYTQIEKELMENPILKNISLMQILPPIAFEIIEKGVQGIPNDDVLHIITRTIRSSSEFSHNPEKISQLLTIYGILIPDSNGNLGFFHQTLLEFLAAKELVIRYRENPSIIEQKINFLRWDETIILFVGLLDEAESSKILKRMAETDIVYAGKSFNASINQDKKFGSFLFNLIISKITDKKITLVEKQNYANGLKYVSQFGDIEKIAILLNDPDVSEIIAPILGNLHHKPSIPKLFELLSCHNCWPSTYATTLSVLIDKDHFQELIIMYCKSSENDLERDNITTVLENFKNDSILLNEVNRLLNSTKSNDIKLGIRLLPILPVEIRNAHFESLLNLSDEDLLSDLLFGAEIYFKRDFPSSQNIEEKLFEFLKHRRLGSNAANILVEISNENIIDRATRLLKTSKDDFEKINLSRIILQDDPLLSKTIIFEYLKKYDNLLFVPLENALRSFDRDKLIPEIFDFISTESDELNVLILSSIRFVLKYDEKITITDNFCESLILLLERQISAGSDSEFGNRQYDTGSFLANNCSLISKKFFIDKTNQPDYLYRKQILGYIPHLPIEKSDFTDETIIWLMKELEDPAEISYRYYWADVPQILGKIFDENDALKNLVPLLSTDNAILKNNVFLAIQEIERKIGKRIVTVSP